MARTRHVIVGGGTAGMNAITTLRQYDHGASEIILVSAERPYARMVLPYYLKGSISESHVYTANPTRLRALGVEEYLGRRAVRVDTQANTLTLDDDTAIPYDDLLIATGSSAVRAPVAGADGQGVDSLWNLEQAQGAFRQIPTVSPVGMMAAGALS